jgi:hypothetical protein
MTDAQRASNDASENSDSHIQGIFHTCAGVTTIWVNPPNDPDKLSSSSSDDGQ